MNINTPTNYRKGPGYIIEIIGSEKGTNETFNATKTGVLKADLETAEKGVTPSPDNIEAVGKRMTAMGYNSSLFINPNVGYPKDTILVDGKVYDILCVEKCTPYKWDPPAERTDLHP